MAKTAAFTLAGALAFLLSVPANAAVVKVYVSGAMAHALEEIAQDFVKRNGHTLEFVVSTTGGIQQKVRAGEKADIVEVTNAGMDALEKEKLVVPGTRIDLASAMIGITVPEGTPVPDISTPEALKKRLLSARAVAYVDPKVGGQAAAAIIKILKDLGIAEQLANKTVLGQTGADAIQKMVRGDADIAITFVSEILPVKGAKLVGPLRASIQNPSMYTGAIGANSANREIAAALLKEMTSAGSRRIMTEAGLNPVAH